jgi:hypothetical protein
MSEHGDDQHLHADDDNERGSERAESPGDLKVPWAAAEKSLLLLLIGSALVLAAGVPGAIQRLMEEPPQVVDDPQAVFGPATEADPLLQFASFLVALGIGASLSLVLLLAVAALLWWIVTVNARHGDGATSHRSGTARRERGMLRAARVLLVTAAAFALGSGVGEIVLFSEYRPSSPGAGWLYLAEFIVPIGIALGAAAAFLIVQTLARDPRALAPMPDEPRLG